MNQDDFLKAFHYSYLRLSDRNEISFESKVPIKLFFKVLTSTLCILFILFFLGGIACQNQPELINIHESYEQLNLQERLVLETVQNTDLSGRISKGIFKVYENSKVPSGSILGLDTDILRAKNHMQLPDSVIILMGGPGVAPANEYDSYTNSLMHQQHDIVFKCLSNLTSTQQKRSKAFKFGILLCVKGRAQFNPV